ncbi:class I adenylate-forming enzyme family protein [Rhodococcus koreensis]
MTAEVTAVPGTDPNYLRRSPVELLLDAEEIRPEAPLLAWPEGRASVAQFAQAARRCAEDLRTRYGIGPGDRVAVVGRNSFDRLAWMYGIFWIGAVEVSVNFELKGAMLRHVLADSDPVLILSDDDLLAEVASAAPTVRVETLSAPAARPTDADAAALDASARQLGGDRLATILYTSGTTGPSKGVMLPHGSFANHAHSLQIMLGLEEGDVGYIVLPFFHVDMHVYLPAVIASGSSIFFIPRFSVRRFWSDIQANSCTWTAAVGSMLAAAATTNPPESEDIPLRRMIAAPVSGDSYEFFEDRLGITILSMYGQTEADGIAHEHPERRRRGSAGVPCPAFDVAILGRDGRRMSPGEVGEICHRPHYPNMVLSGYWRRPEATVQAWKDLWYHTGDLGIIDDDGFLFYRGRITDSLRRRGENISAYELEAVLREAPGVDDAAAIAVVDELGGEDEIKVIVACPDGLMLDSAAFFEFCAENLPRYAIPRFVEQVAASEFVRSPGTGVIQKHRLSKSIDADTVVDRMALEPAAVKGQ